MKDEKRKDGERSEPTEQSGEVESWLREAVRAPHAVRLPGPGDVVGGKYRIEELLGRGGMGAVFRARHVVSDKTVAIKCMLRPASDEQARRRFEREARAAGRIEHPNVVGPYDIGEEGDCSYLVMELLRGESLRARLARGPLEAGEAVQMLIPAMRGVAAAHRAGVVHRDLKPDNIFLCEEPEGDSSVAKVLDFGVSGILSNDLFDSTLTQEGTLLGSLAYMSPEQLSNPHDVDGRADVYAFGVILYEVLTSGLPFRGASHSAVAIAIAMGEPEPPSRKKPNIPAGLEKIVLRALARHRAERYPDMNALIEALLPFCPPPPERATGVGLRESSAEPRSAEPSPPARPPVSERTNAEDPSSRRSRGVRSGVVLAVMGLLMALAALWVFASGRGPDEAQKSAPSAPQPPRAAPIEAPAPKELPPTTAPTTVATEAPATQEGEAARAPAPPSAAAPAKAARARASRPAAPPRAPGSAAKSTGESREDILFSGRK